MANWFKIYETDLDEKRLKYALNKLPEVGWVWIGILSECCKHRSDTIRWSQEEVDIFGFSDALKVTIPKVNHAIELLCEIKYLERLDGFIRVLKWNEKQSEYNHRKGRGDYRRVSDSIGESPLEQRIGEDKSGEGEGEGEAHRFAETPSWEEFWTYAKQIGCHGEAFVRDKFHAADQQHWQYQRNWRGYVNRIKGWWEEKGRPMGNGKSKAEADPFAPEMTLAEKEAYHRKKLEDDLRGSAVYRMER